MSTLDEARDLVMGALDDGMSCPCCGQFAKRYRRKINSGMAALLLFLVDISGDRKLEWIHVKEFELVSREVSKLLWWGLVEEKPKDDDDDSKKASGFWRVTQRGLAFARGYIGVPKYAVVYNRELTELVGDTVHISEALGDNFHFGDLMQRQGAQ